MAFGSLVKCTVWSFRHVKLSFLIRSVSTSRSSRAPKMKFDSPPRTAYFQKKDNSFTVSVFVEYKPLKVEKSFTFWRDLDSKISLLLSRADIKISDYVEKKLKKTMLGYQPPSVDTTIYKNGKQLSADLPCSCLFEKGDIKMKIFGDTYDVVCNSPWVNDMNLPKKILTHTVLYPNKFEAEYTVMEMSTFKWYRSNKIAAYVKSSPVHIKDWIEIGDKYHYIVQNDDIGYYLQLECIPRNEVLTGPKFTAIANSPVAASRDNYNFVKTHLLTKEKADDSKIRVVTYNLLADSYAFTKEAKTIFDYCSPEVLQKDQRYTALAWEVSGYNADLLCLQEVDNCIHKTYILGRLENEGYDGVLCHKANDREGTACYYNKQKFNLISSERFTYGQEVTMNLFLKDIHTYLNQDKDLFAKFKELPHSLQMMVLKPTSKPGHLLVLGNVHLFSQPDADLMRLLQAMVSFRLYEYTVDKLQKERPNDKITFILCGDFNSTPECSINELVTKGFISPEHPIWNSEEVKGAKGLEYKLPVCMASAFPDVKYTNYTRLFKGCLDYIYYQSDFLELSKTYPLPDEDELSENVGLPSIHFPSDHLPLIAELQWKS